MSSVKSVAPSPITFRWRFLDTGALLLLIVFIVWLARTYILQERYFYSWDFANYQDQTIALQNAMHASFVHGLRDIYDSTWQEYNHYFAVPFIPAAFLPGIFTRQRFVVGLAIVYLLPLCLIIGLVATRLFPSRGDAKMTYSPRLVFWTAAALTALSPASWTALLRGYPDCGAALFAALALLLYLDNGRKPTITRSLATGMCLAIAVVLRRHYVYPALSLYAVMLVEQFARVFLMDERSEMLGRFWNSAKMLLIIGITNVALVALLAPGFVQHLLTNNYYMLNMGYVQPIPAVCQFYLTQMGVGLCLTGLVGWGTAAALRLLDRRVACLVLLYCALLAGVWLLNVRQMGAHYMLHFLLIVTFGVTGLFLSLFAVALRLRRRWLALPGVLVASSLVVLNLISSLSVGRFLTMLLHSTSYHPFLAMPWSPLRRDDFGEVVHFLRYLRTNAKLGDSIYVASSSMLFNEDMVRHADPLLSYYLPPGESLGNSAPLQVIDASYVDSRDWYPIPSLITANWMVTATPIQIHLAPDQQKLVLAINRLFGNTTPISQPLTETPESDRVSAEFRKDFVEEPVTFQLQEGMHLHIFRRIHPTPLPTAVRTLQWFRTVIPQRPGSQTDWMPLTSRSSMMEKQGPHQYRLIYTEAKPGASEIVFAFVGDHGATVPISWKSNGHQTVHVDAVSPTGDIQPIPNNPSNTSATVHTTPTGTILLAISAPTPSDHLDVEIGDSK